MAVTEDRKPVPRDRENDYSREAAEMRREFLREQTGASLEHVGGFSFDPGVLPGNVEQFVGVAQVPIGVAGPLLVDGEHAKGEFYVPLATAEGTLVASYNRGMKLLHAAGGVKTTVVDDRMQRAPVFLFASAREAHEFGKWLEEHFEEIKAAAESTTRSGKLLDIEQYSASRMLYTRFNYTTGDAAGQNLTGKATQAACHWIIKHFPAIEQYFLESNFATDKKSSQVNMLRTRGKRVVAEALLPATLLEAVMHANSDLLFRAREVANLGGFMSGVNNNGAHSANGITAIFIATGQDAANVAESSAAFIYAEQRPNGDYYYSVTIPSLIVATYGGGTGLATQRECLELLDCYGAGKVNKLAEIVAATVLCGEMSLGSAIVAEDWVHSHDLLGAQPAVSEVALDPEIEAVVAAMQALPGPPPEDVPIEQARAAHEAETAELCGRGQAVAEVRDHAVPGPGGEIPVRVYAPAGAHAPVPMIAYFHGGGWALGSIESVDTVCRALANAACAVVASVNYRLAPEHPFPAAVDDALAATRWLASTASELGGDGERLAVAGDSAGGNLAAIVARRLRDEGGPSVRFQALVYPATDAGLNMPSYREFAEGYGLTALGMQRFWGLYLDGADGAQPDASPLRADDLSGLPPALVLTAEADVLRDEGEAYAARLRDAGVAVDLRRFEGATHGFWRWQAKAALSRRAVREVGTALREALS